MTDAKSWKDTWGKIDWQKGKAEDIKRQVGDLIASGADVNAKNEQRETPLMWASCQDNPEIVRSLIEQGAEVNVKDNAGQTALFYASLNGSEKVAQTLIEHGADVHLRDEFGYTVLMDAAFSENAKLVQLFIEKGVDVNAKNDYDWTALMFASSANDGAACMEMVKSLLNHGADVNAQSGGSSTPLTEVCKKGHKAVAHLLIEHGADVNAEDKETALREAKNISGNDAVIQLPEKGAKNAGRGLVKKLKGMHKNDKKGEQSTLLHKKAREGR